MNIRLPCILCLIIIWFLSGCSGRSMVVLMPDPQGKVGAVHVSTDAGRVDISEAGHGTVVSGHGKMPSPPAEMPDEEIAGIFRDALRSLPDPPRSFNVYFKFDSRDLIEESRGVLSEVRDEIERENPLYIRVVGHADTSGDEKYNLKLSRERAEAVADMLIGEGIDRSDIQTVFHGENDLFIETADDVVELRNRRVEMILQ